ncbi:MAG TPA: serine/threonine-protein kinase [Kofleriaceae bacterium]|jgi:serine/threonine protein kinase
MNQADVATLPETEGDGAPAPFKLGRFEVVGRLGAGGMGLVFEGRDGVLDRRVALKLLHSGRANSPLAPSRLLREAQALAKLSHPNVVTVYDVAMADDAPFIAMELVEGPTLRAWMDSPHDWRAVLDVFIAVGHGLAAVHALGLVHRDFKPSNVLFDKKGTPKLGDFGLVCPTDHQEGGTPTEDIATSQTLTSTGSVMGTPAYMPPEQREGARVDGRADQYSFAKTLREALGDPPAKLQPIIARAMAERVTDRYPDMNALIADLSRVRRGNRGRWIAVGSSAALLAIVAVAWRLGSAHSAADPCPRPTERVANTWGATRRSALEAHIATLDPVLGPQRFAAAANVLDRGTERWADQNVDACQSARAGRSSDALLDRRLACLDRALLEIDGTVGVLERSSSRATLDDALNAATSLPTLDDCADTNALTELLPRPTSHAERTEADAIAKETVDIDVALRTGGTKDTDVAARAQTVVARARRLNDPVTLARALRSLAGVQLANEAGEPSIATLREGITVGSAAHDDRLVASLYTKLLAQLSAEKKDAEAKTLLPVAEAALARTGASPELEASFLEVKALVESSNGDIEGARQAVADGFKVLADAGASLPSSPLRPALIAMTARSALLHSTTKEWKLMADGFVDAIALSNAQYGPDHPDSIKLHHGRGVALRYADDAEGALAEFAEAARIGEARLAPSPNLAMDIYAVGNTLLALQRTDQAIPVLLHSVEMSRATLPPNDMRLAQPVGTLAAAYFDKNLYADALPLYNEQITILEKRGLEDDDKIAAAYQNRGDLHVQDNHNELAVPDLERARQVYEKLDMHEDMYAVMGSLTDANLNLYQFQQANEIAAQIMAAPDATPEQRVQAKFNQGQARAYLGAQLSRNEEVEQGIAEVRKARAEMTNMELTGDEADLADRWLLNIKDNLAEAARHGKATP